MVEVRCIDSRRTVHGAAQVACRYDASPMRVWFCRHLITFLRFLPMKRVLLVPCHGLLGLFYPLAELNQCIFNSANRLIISVIDVLCDGQCTDFADDAGKQAVGLFCIVADCFFISITKLLKICNMYNFFFIWCAGVFQECP